MTTTSRTATRVATATAVLAVGSRDRDAFRGQIGDDAVQLTVRPRPQRRVHPILELVGLEPSLARGLAQPLRDGSPVGVRGSQ